LGGVAPRPLSRGRPGRYEAGCRSAISISAEISRSGAGGTGSRGSLCKIPRPFDQPYFINGAIAMACMAIGLFFLKFWKTTRDRLFAFFALAFWLLAFDRIVVDIVGQTETSSPEEYLPRLGAFLVIIVANIKKNRQKS